MGYLLLVVWFILLIVLAKKYTPHEYDKGNLGIVNDVPSNLCDKCPINVELSYTICSMKIVICYVGLNGSNVFNCYFNLTDVSVLKLITAGKHYTNIPTNYYR